jgi:hypothetical protein
MRKYSNEINNAQRLLGLCTLLFFCCASCSNVNKGMVDLKKQNIIPEEIKIELDLIKDCLREFINSNKENVDLNELSQKFNITLNTLEKPTYNTETGKASIGEWFIDELGTQEPVAKYCNDWNSESLILEVFLSKQSDGTYKVEDWSDTVLLMEDWGVWYK